MEVPKTKVCTGCGEDKTLDQYYGQKSGKYGRTSKCAECIRIYRSKPELRNRKNEINRKYRSRPEVKERAKEYRSRPESKRRAKELGRKYRSNPEKSKIIKRSKLWNKIAVENLYDTYVIDIIKSLSARTLKSEDIPQELIELKRNALRLKRELKNKSNNNKK